MIRYLLITIFSLRALTFFRAIMGVVQKAVVNEVKSAMGGEDQPAPSQAGKSGPTAGPAATTLRKCVTCGTYKPEGAMIRYGSGDKAVFFCSADCEKKANA